MLCLGWGRHRELIQGKSCPWQILGGGEMGALPKLGVSGAGWGRSCPQALQLGFYVVPLQRTLFWQPMEGGRLRESLVLSPPSFCGRRRCSHRAFTKGASFICLRGCGGLQHFPWCLCCSHNWHPAPQQEREPALSHGTASPLCSVTQHSRPCSGHLSLSWRVCCPPAFQTPGNITHWWLFRWEKRENKIWELTKCPQTSSLRRSDKLVG